MALKKAWEIGPQQIHLENRIDGGVQGANGEVWRAEWDGLVVAVKILKRGLMYAATPTSAAPTPFLPKHIDQIPVLKGTSCVNPLTP